MSERCSTQNFAYFVPAVAGLLSRNNKTIAMIGFVKEWKKAQNKYTENCVKECSPECSISKFVTDPSICFAVTLRMFLQQEHIINKQSLIFKDK